MGKYFIYALFMLYALLYIFSLTASPRPSNPIDALFLSGKYFIYTLFLFAFMLYYIFFSLTAPAPSPSPAHSNRAGIYLKLYIIKHFLFIILFIFSKTTSIAAGAPGFPKAPYRGRAPAAHRNGGGSGGGDGAGPSTASRAEGEEGGDTAGPTSTAGRIRND